MGQDWPLPHSYVLGAHGRYYRLSGAYPSFFSIPEQLREDEYEVPESFQQAFQLRLLEECLAKRMLKEQEATSTCSFNSQRQLPLTVNYISIYLIINGLRALALASDRCEFESLATTHWLRYFGAT